METTPEPPAVRTRHLIKDFRVGLRGVKLRAVDNVSLTVPAGTIYGILGPNGSGKSTTLKVLLGLVSPTAGECSVFGFPAGSVEARARIGFLPEAPYFQRHLSGRELVRFHARMSAVPERELEERVGRALELAGMSEAASRRVGTYSKGMLQRIGLAQAIVHDPPLVILDEPTAGVDPLGAADIARALLAFKQRGKTVVLCSHLLSQVEEVCDRVAIFDRGRLVLEGALADVLSRRGQWTLEVGNATGDATGDAEFPPAARAEVGAVLARHGLRVASIGRSRATLERVFAEKVSRD
ncbi:MAG: ABC transporter ATP-binding protein [Puniceicoccales bacterium]|jgi:ABC-2 type transport system ATP-binding protein|nr:ABC transporter ATP-binding protein [Puniceicoccales bacterium]